MVLALLGFWIISAFLVIVTKQKAMKLVIYFGIFSLLGAGCLVLLAAPDVALAQVVVGIFTVIIFFVTLERHGALSNAPPPPRDKRRVRGSLPYVCFMALSAAVFIFFIPESTNDFALKDWHLSSFQADVGGQNAVTAISLGYRVYDTLFETLMLLVSVLAVIHLSWNKNVSGLKAMPGKVHDRAIAGVVNRFIGPVLLLCGIYITLTGHIFPGGGFQGGAAAALFFVCRYMFHSTYDIQIDKVINVEKVFFVVIALFAVFFVLTEMGTVIPLPKNLYLITMNLLIGVKVACSFLVIFYRLITLERK